MKNKVPVSVSISIQLNDRIEYLAKETDLSKSLIVESAIENGIDQVSASLYRMRPRPQPAQQPQAQATAELGKSEENISA